MPDSVLDRFGRLLMSEVRDRSIRHWKMIAEGSMKGEEALRLHEQFSQMTSHDQDVAMMCAPQIIDIVLHNLLAMFNQEEDLEVSLKLGDGIVPSLRDASDGLCGELYSEEGWIARFSREEEETGHS